MIKNLSLIVFFVVFNITIGLAEIPGKYDIIAPLQPPDAHSLEQVRIDEVLAFDCDHCYQFYRTTYPKLKKKFGNKINIVIRPIGWRGHDPGRLYFIAQKKGKGDQVMATIFDFIHEKGLGKQMYDRDKLQFVARLNGLSNEFKTMMDDKEIVDKMNESVRWAKSRNINSTPTMVIENALIVQKDYFNLVTVINSLLKEPVK